MIKILNLESSKFQRFANLDIDEECDDDSFICTNNNKCIPDYKRCNEKLDCDDGSDEKNCEDYMVNIL